MPIWGVGSPPLDPGHVSDLLMIEKSGHYTNYKVISKHISYVSIIQT